MKARRIAKCRAIIIRPFGINICIASDVRYSDDFYFGFFKKRRSTSLGQVPQPQRFETGIFEPNNSISLVKKVSCLRCNRSDAPKIINHTEYQAPRPASRPPFSRTSTTQSKDKDDCSSRTSFSLSRTRTDKHVDGMHASAGRVRVRTLPRRVPEVIYSRTVSEGDLLTIIRVCFPSHRSNRTRATKVRPI